MSPTNRFQSNDFARDHSERRSTRRLTNYWDSVRSGSGLPVREEFRIDVVRGFRRYGFTLELGAGGGVPTFRFLGSDLRAELGEGLVGRPISVVCGPSLLSWVAETYRELLVRKHPVKFDSGTVKLPTGEYRFRAVMIPFGEDRRTVDFIAGMVTFKKLSKTTLAGPRPAPHALTGAKEESIMVTSAPRDSLAQSLKECQLLAGAVDTAYAAGHRALYEALATAYAFSAEARVDQAGYRRLCDAHGIKPSARSPFTAVIRLVFGKEYDKTRVSEYATCLAHASRTERTPAEFRAFLGTADGGIKACIRAERAARRSAERRSSFDHVAQLRKLGAIIEVPDETEGGEEFVLLLGRRHNSDRRVIQVLRILDEKPQTLTPILKRAARSSGSPSGGAKSLQVLVEKSA